MNDFYRATDYHNDFLVHYGVKDMKWYQRRYQNYDGSLTPLGRIHYGIGEPIRAKLTGDARRAYIAKRKMQKHDRVVTQKKAKKFQDQLERKENKIQRLQNKTKEREVKRLLKEAEKNAKNEKKTEDAREKYLKKITETGDPALINKYKQYLSTDEINAANTRFQALQNVHNNRVAKAKRAGDYLQAIAGYTKTISDISTNLDNTYKQFNQLKGRIDELKKKTDAAENDAGKKVDNKQNEQKQEQKEFFKKVDDVEQKYEKAKESSVKLLENLKEKKETAKTVFPTNEQKMKEYTDKKNRLLKQLEDSRKADNDARVEAYTENKALLLDQYTKKLAAENQARIDDYNRSRMEAEYLLERIKAQ